MAALSTRRAIGLLLLLCVVFIWVGSSFLVSNLFGEQQFNRPFFITYLNTGTFSLYLVGAYISHMRKRRSQRLTQRKRSRSDDSLNGSDHEIDASIATIPPQLTVRETMMLGVSFCILWFAANITQNASLAYTSVANSSILCSTSGLFTLAIGAAAGVEKFNSTRLGAVLVSVLGVYSIMRYGASTATTAAMPLSWFGDFLALLSAMLYGCYTTLLKRKIGDESRLDTPLFFGTVGLANIVLLWPGFIILHLTGVETFQLPASGSIWLMILVNALIGTFLSDYLWLLAVLMTSPLVVTLGLSLTIPLSMAGDIVFKGLSVGLPYYIGALLILAAFIAANL
ncbi:thiamine-repressible mitochondrial transport protein THI74 [Martensiomyces pterosporus]|nr:thiamine-repressible mitochondrial transport protein THI74 [Martensiomyces pterosporus]